MYNPDTKITHLKGSSGITSISKDQRVVTTKNFFQAMKIFYQKHYAKKYFPPIKWLIFTGIDLVKLCKIITIKFS